MENMATIIISLILALVVAAVIMSMVRSKRKGKSSCGGCASCPAGSLCAMNGACHPAKPDIPRK
ncbi:MAG: FeoB-associated Cys-rich membrane protein [Lachnospiraceae bacterium]|jgi:hypothetical protein|nr:FeoB-associated Cys-rich membrane protein [Lachnospiraceae bacterium]